MRGRLCLRAHRFVLAIPALLLTAGIALPAGQTQIPLDKNKYSVAEDVKIGRQAADEARRELPMLNDAAVDNYVEEVGQRLVRGIPQHLRHAGFDYSFDVVNMKEINAFALPGGPMFLHRGMIEAAKDEGEVAGVMAHEIAHVALRHGTAQATKAQKFQIGAIAGQILGAIVGGAAGSVIAQGSNFGLGAYFLKYGREYERQADLMGAQIMARAGYDPRRMADMFRTIEKQGSGRGGPEWMSSHPNPGNRYEAIQKEAAQLRIEGSAPSNAEFRDIKSRLGSMQPAWTAEQVARGEARDRSRRDTGGDTRRTGRGNVRVEPPSTRYQRHTVGNFLRVSVPENWQQVQGNNSVTFAPEGGHYRGDSGGTAFTHGVQIGVVRNETHDLEEGTQELIRSFERGNPELRMEGNFRRANVGGRNGLMAVLSNVSEVSGREEVVTLSTLQLRDGNLLYVIGVAPDEEFGQYERPIQRVVQTLEISDRSSTYR